jgi:hypothetical protein
MEAEVLFRFPFLCLRKLFVSKIYNIPEFLDYLNIEGCKTNSIGLIIRISSFGRRR